MLVVECCLVELTLFGTSTKLVELFLDKGGE